jgi:hypothetical protein
MKKYLVFLDGQRAELSPVTHEEFLRTHGWQGNSHEAFGSYLRLNGWSEIEDFSENALIGATVELVDFPGHEVSKRPLS